MKLRIIYFAKLAEQLKTSSEELDINEAEFSVAQLISLLSQRGEHWQTALHDKGTRCAINQQIAFPSSVINHDAEVAFFPPVTGG